MLQGSIRAASQATLNMSMYAASCAIAHKICVVTHEKCGTALIFIC
nr:MAG TPA: hypothetical protein [Caudoviricetes sp.]